MPVKSTEIVRVMVLVHSGVVQVKLCSRILGVLL